MSDSAPHPDLPYEDWPYDELRDAAFDRARHRRDLTFFIDLMAHTPALAATSFMVARPGGCARGGTPDTALTSLSPICCPLDQAIVTTMSCRAV